VNHSYSFSTWIGSWTKSCYRGQAAVALDLLAIREFLSRRINLITNQNFSAASFPTSGSGCTQHVFARWINMQSTDHPSSRRTRNDEEGYRRMLEGLRLFQVIKTKNIMRCAVVSLVKLRSQSQVSSPNQMPPIRHGPNSTDSSTSLRKLKCPLRIL
jgi:hypothetical protein